MEIAELGITDRIVLCMKEFNNGSEKCYYRPCKEISELEETYRNRITGLSEKYKISEKTIYSIIGYRYP